MFSDIPRDSFYEKFAELSVQFRLKLLRAKGMGSDII